MIAGVASGLVQLAADRDACVCQLAIPDERGSGPGGAEAAVVQGDLSSVVDKREGARKRTPGAGTNVAAGPGLTMG